MWSMKNLVFVTELNISRWSRDPDFFKSNGLRLRHAGYVESDGRGVNRWWERSFGGCSILPGLVPHLLHSSTFLFQRKNQALRAASCGSETTVPGED